MEKKTKNYHILLAEDDDEMRALLVLKLRLAGYDITECRDGVGLLTYLEPFLIPEKNLPRAVDLIISDIRMPGLTGMEILEGMQEHEGYPPVILITAFGDRETHALAENLGAAAMFDKPFDVDELVNKVHELLVGSDRSIDEQEE